MPAMYKHSGHPPGISRKKPSSDGFRRTSLTVSDSCPLALISSYKIIYPLTAPTDKPFT